MRRAAISAVVALAIALGAASGCQGTDPSPNPAKACPVGQVRKIVRFTPPFSYECFPVVTHGATVHRKKKRQ